MGAPRTRRGSGAGRGRGHSRVETQLPGGGDRRGQGWAGDKSTSKKRNFRGTRLAGGALQVVESCIPNQGKEEVSGEVLSPQKPLL